MSFWVDLKFVIVVVMQMRIPRKLSKLRGSRVYSASNSKNTLPCHPFTADDRGHTWNSARRCARKQRCCPTLELLNIPSQRPGKQSLLREYGTQQTLPTIWSLCSRVRKMVPEPTMMQQHRSISSAVFCGTTMAGVRNIFQMCFDVDEGTCHKTRKLATALTSQVPNEWSTFRFAILKGTQEYARASDGVAGVVAAFAATTELPALRCSVSIHMTGVLPR